MACLFTTVLLTFVGVYFIWFVTKRSNKSNEPPMIPYWIPWLGRGMDYQKHPLNFLRRCAERCGPIFTVHMGGRYFTFVTDPFTYPIIAREAKKLNFRLQSIPFVKKVFGFERPGIEAATAGGEFPKILQGNGLEESSKVMMDNLQQVLKKERFQSSDWASSNMLELAYEIMFTAGFKTFVGDYARKDGSPTKRDDLHAIIKDFVTFDDAFPLIAKGYPISSLKGVKEARERLLKMFEMDEMDQREGVHPLLTAPRRYLAEQNRLSGFPGQLLALLFAAESNTVLTAFWALYYILKNPEALAAARKEISEVLEKTSQSDTLDIHLTRQDFNAMPVLDSIIKESLRLTDSPAMLRLATEDYDLNVKSASRTYRIRKGDSVMVILQLTHMDPEIYDDPEQFKFDRFLRDDGGVKTDFKKRGEIVRYHLQPFGSGLSKCPGRYFAVVELKQFLIMMLNNYDIELTDCEQEVGMNLKRVAFGTLPPTSDVPIRFKRRIGTINNNKPLANMPEDR